MASVLLTKRIEFSSSHRYLKPEWDEAKNRAIFGLCYNPPAHGHNYMLEVTVSGEIDPKTGMGPSNRGRWSNAAIFISRCRRSTA